MRRGKVERLVLFDEAAFIELEEVRELDADGAVIREAPCEHAPRRDDRSGNEYVADPVTSALDSVNASQAPAHCLPPDQPWTAGLAVLAVGRVERHHRGDATGVSSLIVFADAIVKDVVAEPGRWFEHLSA
jgi:hypothetical protein